MFLEFGDWLFYADRDATAVYYGEEVATHCTCTHCRNFYRAVDKPYPNIRYFLSRFGVDIEAPESLIPIHHKLYQTSFLVRGRVLRQGSDPIYVDNVPITVDVCPEEEHFLLNLGFLELPWVLDEAPASDVCPAGVDDFFRDFKKKTQQS